MEPRKIIVVNESMTQCVEVMSTAETLAGLKEELRNKGIDYEDKTFVEGRSRLRMTDDSQQLPLTVIHKGQPTNELSFVLMTPDKKISSGSARTELYARVKALNLQDAIKEEFGKNFTQVSSGDLEKIVAEAEGKDRKERNLEDMQPQEEVPEEVTISTCEASCDCGKNEAVEEEEADKALECPCDEHKATLEGAHLVDSFNVLLDMLEMKGFISRDNKNEVLDVLLGKKKSWEAEVGNSTTILEQVKEEFSWMKK